MIREELKRAIDEIGISIAHSGDKVEKNSSKFIVDQIREYETFWKYFVFPYREEVPYSIWLNKDLSIYHEALCIYNYSVFRAAVRVYRLWRAGETEFNLSGQITTEMFDDWLIWLDSSYDKIKQFCGTCIANFTTLDAKSDYKTSENVVRFKNLYPRFKEYSRDVYKDIDSEVSAISQLRNYLIHYLKFPGFKNYIPKNDYLSELSRWSDFRDYIEASSENDPDKLDKLQDRYLFLEARSKRLFLILNRMWREIISKEIGANSKMVLLSETEVHPMIKKYIEKKDTLDINKDEFKTYDYYPYDVTTTSGYLDIPPPESGSTTTVEKNTEPPN